MQDCLAPPNQARPSPLSHAVEDTGGWVDGWMDEGTYSV